MANRLYIYAVGVCPVYVGTRVCRDVSKHKQAIRDSCRCRFQCCCYRWYWGCIRVFFFDDVMCILAGLFLLYNSYYFSLYLFAKGPPDISHWPENGFESLRLWIMWTTAGQRLVVPMCDRDNVWQAALSFHMQHIIDYSNYVLQSYYSLMRLGVKKRVSLCLGNSSNWVVCAHKTT